MNPGIIVLAAALGLAGWYLKGRINVSGCTNIDAQQLQTMLENKEKITVIDVRTPGEYKNGHIPGAKLKPLADIESWSREISPEQPVVLVCASGMRSSSAARHLSQQGFSNLYNLNGGMSRWGFSITK